MTAVEDVREVDPAAWRATVAALREEGYAYLDMLTAVDDDAVFTVVCCLCDVPGGRAVLLRTAVPRGEPVLDSVTGLFPGADWHERETAEMYGVVFAGHPNPGPLLLPDPPGHPLRKDVVLERRSP